MAIRLVLLSLVALFSTIAGLEAGVIRKLPFTISKPGQYTLLKNLTYSGSGTAITVASDDVTIDLKGFTIEGDPNQKVTSETAAIAAFGRKDITIRNGTIRHFFRGIYLEGNNASGGHLVENVRVDQSALLGIQVKGRFSVIRSNRITTVESPTTISGIRYGIFMEGSNTRVVQNDVQGVVPISSTGVAYSILMLNSTRGCVADNRVQAILDASEAAYGIYLNSSPGSIVERNQVSSFFGGITFVNSLYCKYRGNICTDCNGSYSGGVDVGDNQ